MAPALGGVDVTSSGTFFSIMRVVELPPTPECFVKNLCGSGRVVVRPLANAFTSTSPSSGSWRPGASIADDSTAERENGVPVSACFTSYALVILRGAAEPAPAPATQRHVHTRGAGHRQPTPWKQRNEVTSGTATTTHRRAHAQRPPTPHGRHALPSARPCSRQTPHCASRRAVTTQQLSQEYEHHTQAQRHAAANGTCSGLVHLFVELNVAPRIRISARVQTPFAMPYGRGSHCIAMNPIYTNTARNYGLNFRAFLSR
jgi:hypothetical protein